MTLTKDMRDFILLLEKHNVEYALIGGFAVICYGYVRTTQDIDFLIYPSGENAVRMMKALKEFGFGNAGIPEDYFRKEGTAIHLGVEPNRIDLLTCVSVVSNKELFEDIETVEYDSIKLKIISKSKLLKSKKASSRHKDLADAEELEKIEP